MIIRGIHRIVSNPRIYDWSQWLAGGERIVDLVADRCKPFHDSARTVIDVGGGTGLFRRVWPDSVTYICTEIDAAKIRAFRKKYPADSAAMMNGTTSISSESCDVVMINFVLHHLPDAMLDSFLNDCMRVLRRGGVMIIAEPVWAQENLMGQLLWSVDRGSHPRTAEMLEERLFAVGIHENASHIDVIHSYSVFVLRKSTPSTVKI